MKVKYNVKSERGIITIEGKEEFDEIKRAMSDAVSMSGRFYAKRLRDRLVQIEYDNEEL